MRRTKIEAELSSFPKELHPLILGTDVYDSSCSPEARVYYIDRDGGYFLKAAPKGSLAREAMLTRYFHEKGLAAAVASYFTVECDYLLTERVRGEDATHAVYLSDPARLAERSAEILRALHETDFAGCPVTDRMNSYFETVEENYRRGAYDLSFGKFGSAEEAYRVATEGRTLLQNDTLIHGDYCLPNFLMDNWMFSGFIDLGNGGVGDRHVDLFWGAWTLAYNLGTDCYRDRFFDAYGRDRIDPDCLLTVSAAEVFG